MLATKRSIIVPPTRRPFLGQVATRTGIWNQTLADTSKWNSRTGHFVRGGQVVNPQLVIGNWYTSAGVGDLSQGGTKTLTASIEYPAGTFHQVTFGGSTSIVIADGANAVSDPVPVVIPDGAQFFVKMFQTNSVAIQYFDYGQGSGDSINNSGTDETMSTGSGNTVPSFRIPPLAIVAQTARTSIGISGSSNAVGIGETDGTPFGDTGFMRLVGDAFPYINVALSSDSTGTLIGGSSPKRLALLDTYVTHRWIEPGPGDPDIPTIQGYVDAFCARWPKSSLILSDVGPATTSTDSWATTANQTASGTETLRVTGNALFNSYEGFNQLVRIAALTTEPGSTFAILNNGTPNFATIDGQHWSTAMWLIMKANNPFTASMVR